MEEFRGCSHSLMFKPADLLATQVAPTAANIFLAEQPWLLHPNTSRFVTSPCPGYANRPIRATDGKRTCTSQDSQPCRLLLDQFLHMPLVEDCFSLIAWFPAVPQYSNHVSVGAGPHIQPSTFSSSISHLWRKRISLIAL
jgi:hypothetical protein